MMKKLLSILTSLLMVSCLFAGCGKKAAASGESRIVLDLSKELQNEQMELNSLPWFSSPEDAAKAFGLSLNEVSLREGTFNDSPEGAEMYLPVYLKDLETPAGMILYFRSDYPLLQEDRTLKRALTDVFFSVCFADEAEKEAYYEKLRQTAETLEKELPEIYDNPYMEEDRILCEYHPIIEEGPASPFAYSFGTGWSTISLGEESRCERCTIGLSVRQIKPKEERNGSALDMWV